MTMTMTTVAIVVVIMIFNLLVEFFESFQLSCWVLFTLSSRFQGCLVKFSGPHRCLHLKSPRLPRLSAPQRRITGTEHRTWQWHEFDMNEVTPMMTTAQEWITLKSLNWYAESFQTQNSWTRKSACLLSFQLATISHVFCTVCPSVSVVLVTSCPHLQDRSRCRPQQLSRQGSWVE